MKEAPNIPVLLCRALFAGATIEHVRAHRITAPFNVSLHQHDDQLQFDWVVQCRGTAMMGKEKVVVEPNSFLLAGPGLTHAMSLEKLSHESRVYHVRIKLPGPLVAKLRHLSMSRTKLPAQRGIESALADVWRLSVGDQGDSLLARAKLAEAIALWPDREASMAETAKPSQSPAFDRDLDPALQLMDARLHQPPSLEELAESVSLSSRQFSRRFKDALGVSPLDFFDRKRLGLAQQMLAYENATVGEVSERLGFSSLATFSRWFTHLAGESPSVYRSRPHAL
jgi:AraC-like DNA-binding protein